MKLPEELRAALIVIASEHNISVRGKHPIEIIMKLKGTNLTKDDEQTVVEISKFYNIAPERVRGAKK